MDAVNPPTLYGRLDFLDDRSSRIDPPVGPFTQVHGRRRLEDHMELVSRPRRVRSVGASRSAVSRQPESRPFRRLPCSPIGPVTTLDDEKVDETTRSGVRSASVTSVGQFQISSRARNETRSRAGTKVIREVSTFRVMTRSSRHFLSWPDDPPPMNPSWNSTSRWSPSVLSLRFVADRSCAHGC